MVSKLVPLPILKHDVRVGSEQEEIREAPEHGKAAWVKASTPGTLKYDIVDEKLEDYGKYISFCPSISVKTVIFHLPRPRSLRFNIANIPT